MTKCHEDEEKILRDAQTQVQLLESVIFRDGPIDLITATEWGEETVSILREWYTDLKVRLEQKLATDQAALTKIKSANERLRSLKKIVRENSSKSVGDVFDIKSNLFQNAWVPLFNKSYPSTSPDEPI